MNIRNHIQFLLNDETVTLHDVSPSATLLDFLRIERRLVGTKEGCAEGDCGACTVLVGRLSQGELKYETVNSCIRRVGSLDCCHVVTIEYLKAKDGQLHPVQKAMVDCHGSQCGFCTPGIVMSLYALWMHSPNPSKSDTEIALQGNLCRCTGYEPIIRAAEAASKAGGQDKDRLLVERSRVTKALKGLRDGARIEISSSDGRLIVPASVHDFATVRQELPNSTVVAGCTDVGLWVTKFMRSISPAVFIGNLDELQRVTAQDGMLQIGALASYTDLLAVLDKHLPQISEYWRRIGGEQVRNMGTIGGNIANGSPIGDTPPPFIALGASVVLRKGDNERAIPLEEFFIDYGKQDREGGDFVSRIEVPLPGKNDSFAAYKISKRLDEDISSVCGAFRMTLDGGVVERAVVAFGGMAATPKRANAVEAALTGRPFNTDTIKAAQAKFEKDYIPISDWRASADYRMLAAKNLLMRFFLEASGDAGVSRLNRSAAA